MVPVHALRRLITLMLFLTVGSIWIGGCGNSGADTPDSPSQTITVSAASSLTDVFTGLAKKYENQNPGVKVDLNFGSSGDLEKQIVAGAPVDVFAAASNKDTDDLSQKGMLIKDTLIKPVGNDLVLVAPVNSSIAISSINDLTQGSVKKVAVGNPATVPAGRYAQDALTYYKIWDGLQGILVFGENVRQVLDYVARGEVEAGFVYGSDAQARSGDVKVILVAPPESHQPVVYPMAVLAGSQNESLSRQFLDFITSKQNQPVFARYGFKVNE